MATRDELLTAFQNADAAGDTETAKAIAQQLGNQPEVAAADANPVAAPAVGTSPAPSTASVTEDQLRADPDWIAASKTLYAMNKGDTDKPDDTAAANYGLDQMGWFNNNIVQMGLKAASIKSATPAQQQAFLYLTERSKDLAWSGEGVARVAAGVLTDPSTYVGLSSLGFGTVGEIAAATTGKAGLEAVLKAGVNTGARAAIDTGVVAASRDAIAQSVPITAGAQEKLDYGQIARSGAAGAAAGFLLGGALGAGSHIVSHLGDDAAAAATKAADDYMALMQNPALLRSRVVAWYEAAGRLSGVDASRIAAIGYCFGGCCVLEMARSGVDVKAVVSYHGVLTTSLPAEPGAIKGEVAAYCGALDPYAPPETTQGLRREMDAAGARCAITEFAGVYHSFTDPHGHVPPVPGTGYDAMAHKVSWAGTLALLEVVFA